MKTKTVRKLETIILIIMTCLVCLLLIYGHHIVKNPKVTNIESQDKSQEKKVNTYVIECEEYEDKNKPNSYNILDSTIKSTNYFIRNSVNSSEQYLKEEAKPQDGKITTSFGYDITDEEIIMLAKLINREACYEPYDGQVAVGATVINRLNSDIFEGETITEIIKAPGQYDNGIPIETYTYNEENYNAALDAISGVDPTKGAVYYYNPNFSDDTFIPSHILSIIIGNHNFYYSYLK